MSSNPHNEHPSTYFVQDRSNQEELTRLTLQDQIITRGMGGVLPEQPDPRSFRRVLDIGCGTGGWLIEVAKTYPDASMLVGIDVSGKMIEYARAQAAAEQVSDRVEFHVMDALRMLEFPSHSFDLVNQRFGMSYLRTWDWPKLLEEYQRVTRPEGVIRITEGKILTKGSSPAYRELALLLNSALYQAGHTFTLNGDGVVETLPSLFTQYLRSNAIQTRTHTITFRSGTPDGQIAYEDISSTYRTVLPFIRKWSHVPDNYEQLYQQTLADMLLPDAYHTWELLTLWCHTPGQR